MPITIEELQKLNNSQLYLKMRSCNLDTVFPVKWTEDIRNHNIQVLFTFLNQ